MTKKDQSGLPESISRVNIVGTSGSGKSTFGKKLAEILRVPYIEMDKVFWEPNWKQPSDEVFFERLRRELGRKDWVVDGNYTRSISIKWENVDLVVWLDYSFSRTLTQAVKRAAKRAWSQEELWSGTGNRESFIKSFFSKHGIIWWTISTHGSVRKKYESYMADPKFSHIGFVRLRSHREADQFLERIKFNSAKRPAFDRSADSSVSI